MVAIMDMAANASSPLDDLRHRVPKLTEATIDYGLTAQCTGFSVKLVWILGYSLLMRAVGWQAVPVPKPGLALQDSLATSSLSGHQ